MTQLSLDQLLVGLRDQLAELAKAATGDYEKAQLKSAAELVTYLRPRVTWDPDQVLGWIDNHRDALTRAQLIDPDALPLLTAALALPVPRGARAVEDYAAAFTDALVELDRVIHSYSGTADEDRRGDLGTTVRSIVTERIERDIALLRG